VVGEADPVAEERAVRERARRVDRDDSDLGVPFPHVPDERRDEARLADAGRPRDADRVRTARLGIELPHEVVRERVAVLDERDRACERAPVAVPNAGGEGLAGPRAPAGHEAML